MHMPALPRNSLPTTCSQCLRAKGRGLPALIHAGLAPARMKHRRSTCDLGSSLENVLNRGLLALQIILSSAILALMTSTDAQPLLSLRKIPGVRSKRLLVWSFVVSTGLLQFVTLFLTVEAVFLPQILNDRKCDYSDDNAATDSAFTVV